MRAESVQAPSCYSWRSSAVAHLRGCGLSRRRFHGGFHAYLLLLIDWWGPLSHRPSKTKPITSHEAVWPCQDQPCSVPASPWHAAKLALPAAGTNRCTLGSVLARHDFDHTMAVCGMVGRWGLRVFRGRIARLCVMATPLLPIARSGGRSVLAGKALEALPGTHSHPFSADTPEGLPPCYKCRSVRGFKLPAAALRVWPEILFNGGYQLSP